MISPDVTELPLRLEPISRDTFIERSVEHGPDHPPESVSRALRANVIQLRPIVRRGVPLAA